MLYSKWRMLPIHVRQKFASDFGVIKKGSTHVFDNRIESDGYDIAEIEEVFTIEKLQNYLKTKSSDPDKLVNMLIERVNNPMVVIEPAKVSAPIEQGKTAQDPSMTLNNPGDGSEPLDDPNAPLELS